MMRYFFLLMTALMPFALSAQEITGKQLLEKAIRYHDPNASWSSFKGELEVNMSTPDGKERISNISLNLPKEYFQLISVKDGTTIKQTLDRGECELMLNGNKTISEEEIKTHRLTCERTQVMKNYYTYLYGLPMKLKNSGTIIASKIQKKMFKGKEYLVLKATYTEEVGEDTWYFYFDPETYAMQIYQFFHDESKNDGEYILLTDEVEVFGIKMPKIRAWYYNKDNKYLGTDNLTKASSL